MRNTLRIEIKNSKPVDISDFTATLNAIGSLYSSFVKRNGRNDEEARAKLVVEKVQEGSILIFLQEAITEMLPIFGDANILVEFTKNIVAIKDWFLYGRGKEPEMTINDCRDMREINALVANDNGSQMSFEVLDESKKVIFDGCTFNFFDGNQMRDKMQGELAKKKTSVAATIHHNQVMKIYQVRNDSGSEEGNKAIIDELYPNKKMKVWFNTPELKSAILYSDDNPTQMGFLVDVIIKTVEEKPVGYLVTALNDTFKIED